jgi:hypothetical protein
MHIDNATYRWHRRLEQRDWNWFQDPVAQGFSPAPGSRKGLRYGLEPVLATSFELGARNLEREGSGKLISAPSGVAPAMAPGAAAGPARARR